MVLEMQRRHGLAPAAGGNTRGPAGRSPEGERDQLVQVGFAW
jgi:hypothetical protein